MDGVNGLPEISILDGSGLNTVLKLFTTRLLQFSKGKSAQNLNLMTHENRIKVHFYSDIYCSSWFYDFKF